MQNDLIDLSKAIDKAIQTSSNGPASMGITKTPEIQSKTVKYQPFLEYLEQTGRTFDVTTANVSFYEETGENAAQWIAEAGDLPEYGAKNFTEVPQKMRTIAAPIQISDIAAMGTDVIDLKAKFLEEGYINVNNKINACLLKGNATSNPNEFNSITTGVSTVTAGGNPISKDIIRQAFEEAIDAGGSPDIIVTDAAVGNQLDDIIDPLIRYENPAEIALGHKVTTYRSPDGSYVPIIIDKNSPTSTTGSGSSAKTTHSLAILDSSTIEVKYLTRPSFIQLARTKLASNDAVFAHVVAHNTGAFKSRVITNIGEATRE